MHKLYHLLSRLDIKIPRISSSLRLRQIYSIAYRKNWETHVDNGRKTWYTHKRPSCFMCEDQQFISVIVQSFLSNNLLFISILQSGHINIIMPLSFMIPKIYIMSCMTFHNKTTVTFFTIYHCENFNQFAYL